MTIIRSIVYDHKTGRITATLNDYGKTKYDVVKLDDGYMIRNIVFNEKTNSNDYELLREFIEEVEMY